MYSSGQEDSWGHVQGIVNGNTEYGMATVIYRGVLYGFMTQTQEYPGIIFYNTLDQLKWKDAWVSVNEHQFKAKGQVSVAVLDDRLFLFFTGLNNKNYMSYTTDFVNWSNAREYCMNDIRQDVSPSATTFGGQLYIVTTQARQPVYWATVNKENIVTQEWTNRGIEGVVTEKSAALVVHNGKLYFIHVGLNQKAIYIQTMDRVGGNWTGVSQIVADVTSGICATVSANSRLYIAYRASDGGVRWNAFDGLKWAGEQAIPNVRAAAELSLCSFDDKVFLTFGAPHDSPPFQAFRLSESEPVVQEEVVEKVRGAFVSELL